MLTQIGITEKIGAESVVLEVGSEWLGWLMENERRGCSPESMAAAMISAGLDRDAANAAVRAVQNGRKQPMIERSSGHSDEVYRYDLCPVPGGTTIRAHDRDVAVLARTDRPQIVLFGDVLSFDECDQLVELSQHHLERSLVVDLENGGRQLNGRRSKEGVRLSRSEDSLIDVLDRRVSVLMGCPTEQGEDFLVRRHRIGDESSPTFDFFQPEDPAGTQQQAAGGQRVATLLIWLTDDIEGGEMVFPEIGLTIAPSKGGAVYFRYFNSWGQVDSLTLHSCVPVIDGERWTMTKWMRQYRLR